MTITRAAAISLGLALSWQAHATEPPRTIGWFTDDASLSVHTECLDGFLSVRRESYQNGSVRTEMGYSVGDTCNSGGKIIASGNGVIPNDVLIGTGKTTLRLVVDSRTLPDFTPEGEPVVIDLTWAAADEGDFYVSVTRGHSLQRGAAARFKNENAQREAKVTGEANLFVPTDALIGWSRNRSMERDQSTSTNLSP